MPRVLFSAVFAKLAEKQNELIIPGKTLIDVLSTISESYPRFKDYLFDHQGNLSHFVNFYLNGQDIRHLENEKTHVHDNDVISIVHAIAGG